MKSQEGRWCGRHRSACGLSFLAVVGRAHRIGVVGMHVAESLHRCIHFTLLLRRGHYLQRFSSTKYHILPATSLHIAGLIPVSALFIRGNALRIHTKNALTGNSIRKRTLKHTTHSPPTNLHETVIFVVLACDRTPLRIL